MEAEDVSRNINKRVHYINLRHNIDADYIFTAYTIRKYGDKFLRQAELKDIKANGSIIIVPLKDVIEIDDRAS